jgi:hypothetical protein
MFLIREIDLGDITDASGQLYRLLLGHLPILYHTLLFYYIVLDYYNLCMLKYLRKQFSGNAFNI